MNIKKILTISRANGPGKRGELKKISTTASSAVVNTQATFGMKLGWLMMSSLNWTSAAGIAPGMTTDELEPASASSALLT